MKTDSDITADLREILKLATPKKPEPDGKRLSPRENRFRTLFFITAIASISLAVFFVGPLGISSPDIEPDLASAEAGPPITPASYTDQQILPVGKITSPKNQAITDRTVTVTGYTMNVPVDTPYIWLMVDVPSIGRTWPKKPAIQPNGSFRVSLYEGGPGNEYTVSLYAVGYGLNRLIEQWLADGNFGGLPMIPAQYRLDSVRLVLGGV